MEWLLPKSRCTIILISYQIQVKQLNQFSFDVESTNHCWELSHDFTHTVFARSFMFSQILLSWTFLAVTCATSGGIQEFLVDNGHRNIDIFYNSSEWRIFSLKDVFVARLHMENIRRAHQDSFGIFVFDSSSDDLVSYLTAIMQRQIKMSLLVLSKPWDNDKTNLIMKHLFDLQATTYFYVAMPASSFVEITWLQIISLKSGSTISNLTFAKNSFRIIETWDLQGLQITSTSLTWPPYLTIDGCNEDGLKCKKNYGYLIDIMDKLAFKFNFTYISQKNMDNDWGSFGINGTYGGVLGDVKNNSYDMCLSTWRQNSVRVEIFDFVPLLPLNYIVAMKPQHPKYDFGLFTRAFVGDTLAYIIAMVVPALCLTLFVSQYCLDENMNSVKILSFVWWLCFTLFNAYYCGVLTMFFATTTPMPFDTISDAIQAYPNWKFMFLNGAEMWIHDGAKQGNTDFITLWKRYQENPSETMYDSIEHGLKLIEQGQNVIYCDINMILGHLKSNPTKQKIHFIYTGKFEFDNLIFGKNSPLLPMFTQGIINLRENGLERQIFHRWFGDSHEVISSEKNILTLGQLMSAFTMIVVLLVIALFFLCGELTFKGLLNKFTEHYQKGETE